jgi:hypothetical protein
VVELVFKAKFEVEIRLNLDYIGQAL